MANFAWKNTAGGDWSDASNWLGFGTPPPGAGDKAVFVNLPTSYTVTVKAGMTVGGTNRGPHIAINADQFCFTGSPAFSISGSLTTDGIVYFTSAGGPATSITVEAGGSLHATSLLYSIDVLQTLTISGKGVGGHLELGNLTVGGFVCGHNSLVTLDFDNTSSTTLNTGVIQFDNANCVGALAEQRITDVAWGNEFKITGANFIGDTVTFDAPNNDVIVKDACGTIVFTMNNVFLQDAGTTFVIAGPDTIEAVCYGRGTMIRTTDGELPVEELRSGKRVITLVDGEEIPQTVIWLGHRRIDLTTHLRPETVAPIRIERDAIADGMPHRDLLVSPDHAIFVEGVLICARQLVNGTTIRRERDWTVVDYYHVELDHHAILLAEGLPTESYLDTGNSGFFANAEAPLVLHPDLTDQTAHPTREAGSCAPFVWDEASVRPVWQRLLDRATALGRTVSARGTTTEPDLRLVAGRRTIKPVFSHSDRVIFVLPGGTSEVGLVSRAQSPTEARPWLSDQRRLGVRVKRIVLRGADEVREVPVDHPDFTHGWWAVERDETMMSRWTDGEAVLPLPALRGDLMLEIYLGGAMTFVVDVPEVETEQRAAA
jgi:hypothetical protein